MRQGIIFYIRKTNSFMDVLGKLTKKDLILLIDSRINEYCKQKKIPDFVYGIAGLCSLLNIKRDRASKLIASGKIPVLGTPKKMIFPVAEVLKAMRRDMPSEQIERANK